MAKSIILAFALLILSIAIGIYLLPRMPDTVAMHWDGQGNVNGYSSRFMGLFFMPILMAFLLLLFLVIPYIDPLRRNIEQFRGYFNRFIAVIIAFMFYVHLLTIAYNLGYKLDMLTWLLPGFALLFFYIGILISHAKRNWFVGIRTPWTLSSDDVWNKTHKLGGKLYKICGLAALAGIFFAKYAILFIIAPIIAASIALAVYSYIIYRRKSESKKRK